MPSRQELEVKFTATARREIVRALRISLREFGADAALRYQGLIEQAIIDVAEVPTRPGSQARDKIGRGIRTYHLSLSRDRARTKSGKVTDPRHLVLYRVAGSSLEIVRLIHDSQDLGKLKVKP